MMSPQSVSILLAAALALSCSSLNYSGTADAPVQRAAAEPADAASVPPTGADATPVSDPLVPVPMGPTEDEEPPRSWSELTQLARKAQARNDYDEAGERLEQAALLVADLPPTNARRATTVGLRARHAMGLAARSRLEESDRLADELFAEVEAEPALAGPALVPLAISVADRRRAAAEQAGQPDLQLPLLRIAIQASQRDTASRERLSLAFRVSGDALYEGDLDLARAAIDQALLDSQHVAPFDLMQAGSLNVYRARIALAQGDLETAEASAALANRLFEEADGGASSRAVAEATLARVVAERGDLERAIAIARSAQIRLESDEILADHARRQILGGIARVEALRGDVDAARAHYRSALAVPAVDFREDATLMKLLTTELDALDATGAAARP